MDIGQMIFVYSRLVFGGAAAFLAIMLLLETRDIAWMMVMIGIIIMYVDLVYSALGHLRIIADNIMLVGSVSLAVILLPALQISFFIAAFVILIIRKHRQK